MARFSKPTVMISSKCETQFPFRTGGKLSDIRMDLKRDIEAAIVAGRRSFEVWDNESTSRQVCERQIGDEGQS
jgi:hypothetical protein